MMLVLWGLAVKRRAMLIWWVEYTGKVLVTTTYVWFVQLSNETLMTIRIISTASGISSNCA